jgi:hypothetical protein
MTDKISGPAMVMTGADPSSEILPRRLRMHLQSLAALRLPIIYREVAKELLLVPPNTIHQVTRRCSSSWPRTRRPVSPSLRLW